ncbi:MAG: O-antigen ligase family protein [Bacteroidetes bacterium]|nr:O-antigen ligase family protein [Bacteroidota bacterium]
MQTLLQSYKAQAVICLFIWLVSMVLSAEFVLSVSMIVLLALSLFQLKIDGPKVHFTLRDSLRENFRQYWNYKAWLAVSVPFLLVLVSWLWSTDLVYTLERLRIKLPFLVLPFAFASMPPLRRREIFTILYFLLVMMSIISLYVLLNFIANFDAVIGELGRGGHLPTPSNHIRFSIMLALAIIGGLALWVEKFHFQQPGERWFIGGLTLFLFVFIHVLSVRSGLISFYLALLALGVFYVYFKKKYLIGLVGIAAVVVLPLAAYFTLPSFKTKVDYARWDYLQFRQGTGTDYPDSERFTSIKIGLEIGHEHPLLGVGAGDLRQAVQEKYETGAAGKYKFRFTTNNQLVTVYAGTGLVGLALFFVGFFCPLFYRKNFRNPLLLALHAIVLSSFFVDNTIENNFGTSLYLFFLLMGLNYLSNEEKAGEEVVKVPFLKPRR